MTAFVLGASKQHRGPVVWPIVRPFRLLVDAGGGLAANRTCLLTLEACTATSAWPSLHTGGPRSAPPLVLGSITAMLPYSPAHSTALTTGTCMRVQGG
eukprot:2183533-Pyramimonas_sp.AAC.1